MSLQARITALALVLLALCASHWRAYTAGQQRQRDAQAAAQLQATQTQAAAAIRQADNTIEAQHDRAKTETRISADRLRTAGQLDSLRTDLQTARAAAVGADACTADASARDALLAAMARDIERLGEQGAAIAAAADGHAADALMLWRVAAPPQHQTQP